MATKEARRVVALAMFKGVVAMHDYGSGLPLPPLTRTDPSVLTGSAIRTKNDKQNHEPNVWQWTLGTLLSLLTQQSERIMHLEQQLTLDELTGLMNRRGFYNAFESEIDRTSRSQSHGGLLIVIDLDNFKMVNDTYGHQAGDAALRLVARTLKNNSRKMDACARLGGDEFVLLLANTERDKALVRAQNLIKQLNSLSLVWYGAEIPIRASLGLKEYGTGDKPEDIFGQADDRLYNQKRSNKGLSERTFMERC